MKYIKLFENFESYDPYELMILPPNVKAKMIVEEIKKDEPNLNLVSDLIVLGANVDWRDEHNGKRTALHWAAERGKVDVARILIDAKANLDVQDRWDWTPLNYAAEFGRVEIVRMLIGAKANLNVQDWQGWTPLHRAARNGRVEVAQMLIGAKANLDVQDNWDWTPLHWAVMNGKVEIVKILIDVGARKDIRDSEGRTPYELAKTEELKKLLEPNLTESFEPHDPYELMMIPPNKKAEMIVKEINKDEPNLNLVSDLIVLGANLDWQDEDKYGYAPLHYAIDCGEVEIARMLIDAGADVDVQDEDGSTALHLAAMFGEIEIVQMLIDVGADKDIQNKRGNTPLHNAARYGAPLHYAIGNGQVEIARMLIGAGARKDIRDNDGKLPYDLTTNEELKKLLNPNLSESFDSYDPYELMIIPPNKKAEMIVDEIKKFKPNLNLVSDLIVLGANLDWQDEDNRGMTPLYRAAYYENVEIVRILIDAGADVNVQDEYGRTPLHVAANYGYVKIVRMLIDAGARKDISNIAGKLPYDLARTEELKKLLKS